MSQWIEVNVPVAPEARTALLLDVVEPLVHDELGDQVDIWFYFWEPELRLRIRWLDSGLGAHNRASLARLLDAARAEGKLDDWYEGNHGERGEAYRGEADFYGEEVWELVAKDWMSGSELALAIARFEADGTLSKPRSFHWQRRVHLFSNQLLVDEIALCLAQAHGYLGMTSVESPRISAIRSAIEQYLSPQET
jgi:hypothetical protein